MTTEQIENCLSSTPDDSDGDLFDMEDEEHITGKYSMSSFEHGDEINIEYKEQHDKRAELISTTIKENYIANSYEANLKVPNGTQWFEIPLKVSDTVGPFRTQNVLTESPGRTSNVKRNVDYGTMMSTFSLFIDNSFIQVITKCTEAAASIKLNHPTWTVKKEEIGHMFAIMYSRGIIGRGQSLYSLWYKKNNVKRYIPGISSVITLRFKIVSKSTNSNR
nr:uncharacterized protein LOC121117573 [Lepeophtheirus salmonis]